MSNKAKILCPVDFSKDADYAVAYASRLAPIVDAEVHCVHVIDSRSYGSAIEGAYVSAGSTESSIQQIEQHVHEEFHALIKRFELLHFDAQGHFLHGDPSREIIKLADELEAEYIVMATHGRTGFDQWVFGSTCEKVVRLSHVPVLTVRPPEVHWTLEDLSVSFKRVLCPLDFSDFSRAGLETARALCKRFEGTLVLAHAVDTRLEYPVLEPGVVAATDSHFERDAQAYMEKISESLDDVFCEIRVVSGNPHTALVNLIKSDDIDLVVMTTHGHRGLSHMLLGSLADRIVKRSPSPVLTIHPDKDTKRKQTMNEAG
ncbi:MAG: universal stress protein [Candidatus Hydrogenedentota bacterium]